jgi:hypothetical protein
MAAVNVSSWVRGNRLEEMNVATVGDILQQQSISTNESNVEVVDAAGNPKPSRVNTPLADGDTVQIMKKNTKSGTTGRTNGVSKVDVGLPTTPSMLHKVPTEPKRIANKATGGQAKYPLRIMKKKASFDVPFTPRSNKQTKKVVTRVDAAIRHFRKSHPRITFTTRLMVTGPKGTKTSNGHTHLIRVWRLK